MFSSQPAPWNNNKIDKGDSYEDDFEPESNSEDVPKDNTNITKENGEVNDENEPPLRASSPTEIDKEQGEVESLGKRKSNEEASDNDSEMDADAYNFTEDQKRAMMELLVQKQEDSDLLEDPPEYNVKGRLEQLNAELANEPTPVEGNRELKVGFKSEIVDIVAPPPDFSDDESQPNSARGEHQVLDTEPKPHMAVDCPDAGSGRADNENDSKNQEMGEKQFVIEREGNFEVLSADELTSSERAMLLPEPDDEEKEKSADKDTKQKNSETASQDVKNGSAYQSDVVVPKPPSRPRPNTATTGPRRNVRPAQSPRPKSASHSNGSNSSLNNFSYTSPYAMSPEQKEQARDVARRSEEERKERERRKQEEDKERHEENERSFQAWLKAKRDENQRRQDADDERQQSEQERTEENAEAYKMWLKEKRSHGKKEKLLKRRQQEEMMEAYYIRPREECDKAFKEWLKKKNADLRRQHEMERQRSKMYRIQVKRSKKTQTLLKAMKESQAFRYVDYYGYRY